MADNEMENLKLKDEGSQSEIESSEAEYDKKVEELQKYLQFIEIFTKLLEHNSNTDVKRRRHTVRKMRELYSFLTKQTKTTLKILNQQSAWMIKLHTHSKKYASLSSIYYVPEDNLDATMKPQPKISNEIIDICSDDSDGGGELGAKPVNSDRTEETFPKIDRIIKIEKLEPIKGDVDFAIKHNDTDDSTKTKELAQKDNEAIPRKESESEKLENLSKNDETSERDKSERVENPIKLNESMQNDNEEIPRKESESKKSEKLLKNNEISKRNKPESVKNENDVCRRSTEKHLENSTSNNTKEGNTVDDAKISVEPKDIEKLEPIKAVDDAITHNDLDGSTKIEESIHKNNEAIPKRKSESEKLSQNNEILETDKAESVENHIQLNEDKEKNKCRKSTEKHSENDASNSTIKSKPKAVEPKDTGDLIKTNTHKNSQEPEKLTNIEVRKDKKQDKKHDVVDDTSKIEETKNLKPFQNTHISSKSSINLRTVDCVSDISEDEYDKNDKVHDIDAYLSDISDTENIENSSSICYEERRHADKERVQDCKNDKENDKDVYLSEISETENIENSFSYVMKRHADKDPDHFDKRDKCHSNNVIQNKENHEYKKRDTTTGIEIDDGSSWNTSKCRTSSRSSDQYSQTKSVEYSEIIITDVKSLAFDNINNNVDDAKSCSSSRSFSKRKSIDNDNDDDENDDNEQRNHSEHKSESDSKSVEYSGWTKYNGNIKFSKLSLSCNSNTKEQKNDNTSSNRKKIRERRKVSKRHFDDVTDDSDGSSHDTFSIRNTIDYSDLCMDDHETRSLYDPLDKERREQRIVTPELNSDKDRPLSATGKSDNETHLAVYIAVVSSDDEDKHKDGDDNSKKQTAIHTIDICTDDDEEEEDDHHWIYPELNTDLTESTLNNTVINLDDDDDADDENETPVSKSNPIENFANLINATKNIPNENDSLDTVPENNNNKSVSHIQSLLSKFNDSRPGNIKNPEHSTKKPKSVENVLSKDQSSSSLLPLKWINKDNNSATTTEIVKQDSPRDISGENGLFSRRPKSNKCSSSTSASLNSPVFVGKNTRNNNKKNKTFISKADLESKDLDELNEMRMNLVIEIDNSSESCAGNDSDISHGFNQKSPSSPKSYKYTNRIHTQAKDRRYCNRLTRSRRKDSLLKTRTKNQQHHANEHLPVTITQPLGLQYSSTSQSTEPLTPKIQGPHKSVEDKSRKCEQENTPAKVNDEILVQNQNIKSSLAEDKKKSDSPNKNTNRSNAGKSSSTVSSTPSQNRKKDKSLTPVSEKNKGAVRKISRSRSRSCSRYKDKKQHVNGRRSSISKSRRSSPDRGEKTDWFSKKNSDQSSKSKKGADKDRHSTVTSRSSQDEGKEKSLTSELEKKKGPVRNVSGSSSFSRNKDEQQNVKERTASISKSRRSSHNNEEEKALIIEEKCVQLNKFEKDLDKERLTTVHSRSSQHKETDNSLTSEVQKNKEAARKISRSRSSSRHNGEQKNLTNRRTSISKSRRISHDKDKQNDVIILEDSDQSSESEKYGDKEKLSTVSSRSSQDGEKDKSLTSELGRNKAAERKISRSRSFSRSEDEKQNVNNRTASISKTRSISQSRRSSHDKEKQNDRINEKARIQSSNSEKDSNQKSLSTVSSRSSQGGEQYKSFTSEIKHISSSKDKNEKQHVKNKIGTISELSSISKSRRSSNDKEKEKDLFLKIESSKPKQYTNKKRNRSTISSRTTQDGEKEKSLTSELGKNKESARKISRSGSFSGDTDEQQNVKNRKASISNSTRSSCDKEEDQLIKKNSDRSSESEKDADKEMLSPVDSRSLHDGETDKLVMSENKEAVRKISKSRSSSRDKHEQENVINRRTSISKSTEEQVFQSISGSRRSSHDNEKENDVIILEDSDQSSESEKYADKEKLSTVSSRSSQDGEKDKSLTELQKNNGAVRKISRSRSSSQDKDEQQNITDRRSSISKSRRSSCDKDEQIDDPIIEETAVQLNKSEKDSDKEDIIIAENILKKKSNSLKRRKKRIIYSDSEDSGVESTKSICEKFINQDSTIAAGDGFKATLLKLIEKTEGITDAQLIEIHKIIMKKSANEKDGSRRTNQGKIKRMKGKSLPSTSGTLSEVIQSYGIPSSSSPSSTLKRSNTKKKRKTELDKLCQDINDCFIRDGILSANGKRRISSKSFTCYNMEASTDDYDDDDYSFPPMSSVLNEIQEEEKHRAEDSIAAIRAYINNQKIYDDTENNDDDDDENNNDDGDITDLEDEYNTPNGDDVVLKECTVTLERLDPNVIRNCERHDDVSSNGSDTECDGQSNSINSYRPVHVEESMPFILKLNRVRGRRPKPHPKNIDKTQHCRSKLVEKCRLCIKKRVKIVEHYVQDHKNMEVYVARLPNNDIERLERKPMTVKRKSHSTQDKSKPGYSAKCIFCKQRFNNHLKSWYEHFTGHTGEYAYECTECGERKISMNHLIHYCSTDKETGYRVSKIYQFDLNVREILAYSCCFCNYVQLHKSNVIKHLTNEHELPLLADSERNIKELVLLKIPEKTAVQMLNEPIINPSVQSLQSVENNKDGMESSSCNVDDDDDDDDDDDAKTVDWNNDHISSIKEIIPKKSSINTTSEDVLVISSDDDDVKPNISVIYQNKKNNARNEDIDPYLSLLNDLTGTNELQTDKATGQPTIPTLTLLSNTMEKNSSPINKDQNIIPRELNNINKPKTSGKCVEQTIQIENLEENITSSVEKPNDPQNDFIVDENPDFTVLNSIINSMIVKMVTEQSIERNGSPINDTTPTAPINIALSVQSAKSSEIRTTTDNINSNISPRIAEMIPEETIERNSRIGDITPTASTNVISSVPQPRTSLTRTITDINLNISPLIVESVAEQSIQENYSPMDDIIPTNVPVSIPSYTNNLPATEANLNISTLLAEMIQQSVAINSSPIADTAPIAPTNFSLPILQPETCLTRTTTTPTDMNSNISPWITEMIQQSIQSISPIPTTPQNLCINIPSPKVPLTTKTTTKVKEVPKCKHQIVNIGYNILHGNKIQYICLISDCGFSTVEGARIFRNHIVKHKKKWNGICNSCNRTVSLKRIGKMDEFEHMRKCHLSKIGKRDALVNMIPPQQPQQQSEQSSTSSAKPLRPWNIVNVIKILKPWLTKSISKKSIDICMKYLTEDNLCSFYKCMGNDCVFATYSGKKFKEHIAEHELQNDIDTMLINSWCECCYCEKSFDDSLKLFSHIKNSHASSVFQCSMCFYRCSSAYGAKIHQNKFHRNNIGQEKLIYICNGKLQTFRAIEQKILQLREINVQPFICGICQAPYYAKQPCIDHVRREHPQCDANILDKLPEYSCVYCSYQVMTDKQIIEHLVDNHPEMHLCACRRTIKEGFTNENCYDNVSCTELARFENLVDKKLLKKVAQEQFDDDDDDNDELRNDILPAGSQSYNFGDIILFDTTTTNGEGGENRANQQFSALMEASNYNIQCVAILVRCNNENCFKFFDNMKSLEDHLDECLTYNNTDGVKYLKEKNWPCNPCNRLFNEFSSIVQHMLHVHNAKVSFKCDFCPFIENEYKAIKKHIIVCHNDKPICVQTLFKTMNETTANINRKRSLDMPNLNLSPIKRTKDSSSSNEFIRMPEDISRRISPNLLPESSFDFSGSGNLLPVLPETGEQIPNNEAQRVEEPPKTTSIRLVPLNQLLAPAMVAANASQFSSTVRKDSLLKDLLNKPTSLPRSQNCSSVNQSYLNSSSAPLSNIQEIVQNLYIDKSPSYSIESNRQQPVHPDTSTSHSLIIQQNNLSYPIVPNRRESIHQEASTVRNLINQRNSPCYPTGPNRQQSVHQETSASQSLAIQENNPSYPIIPNRRKSIHQEASISNNLINHPIVSNRRQSIHQEASTASNSTNSQNSPCYLTESNRQPSFHQEASNSHNLTHQQIISSYSTELNGRQSSIHQDVSKSHNLDIQRNIQSLYQEASIYNNAVHQQSISYYPNVQNRPHSIHQEVPISRNLIHQKNIYSMEPNRQPRVHHEPASHNSAHQSSIPNYPIEQNRRQSVNQNDSTYNYDVNQQNISCYPMVSNRQKSGHVEISSYNYNLDIPQNVYQSPPISNQTNSYINQTMNPW